jgi:hypothetical protein
VAAITLIEAAKLARNNGEDKRAAIIAIYARNSAWGASIPFANINGNSVTYSREGMLPGIAFRGINEGYVASAGVINPLSESLRIAGGDLDVDRFLIDTMGIGIRSKHEEMKVKALAHAFTTKLIKGDSTVDAREFDGLQRRIPVEGTQFISAGTTDAGDPPSLFLLDQLIARTAGPNKQLWMPEMLALRLTVAARDKDVGGNITYTTDEFGQQVRRYNGIPIVTAYPNNDGDDPLQFDEQGDLLGTPGGSTSASIYCVSLAEGYLSGIQNGPMQVRDLGELDTLPVLRTRVEWYPGLLVEHPRAVSRYGGISNAPWTK